MKERGIYKEWSKALEISVQALFYEERWSNGGGSIGYDIKEKRGYYAYAHH